MFDKTHTYTQPHAYANKDDISHTCVMGWGSIGCLPKYNKLNNIKLKALKIKYNNVAICWIVNLR